MEETIFNGIVDWLHQGSIVYSPQGTIQPSPQGSWVAFAEYDLSSTPIMTNPIYGNPFDPTTYQYPSSFDIRYPKAGSPLPVTTLYVYNADNPGSIPLPVRPPVELNSFSDGIITTASDWVSEGNIKGFVI